jgi:hypothetical protein
MSEKSSARRIVERTERRNNVASDRVAAQVDNSQSKELQQLANARQREAENRTVKTSSANGNCRDWLIRPETKPGLPAVPPSSAVLLELAVLVLIPALLAVSLGVRR